MADEFIKGIVVDELIALGLITTADVEKRTADEKRAAEAGRTVAEVVAADEAEAATAAEAKAAAKVARAEAKAAKEAAATVEESPDPSYQWTPAPTTWGDSHQEV